MTASDLSALLRAWRGVHSPALGDKGARGHHLSQSAAAAQLGVPLKTYQKWEQGTRLPSALALQALLSRLTPARMTRPTKPGKTK